jgi:hypothetical protein
MSPVSIVEHSAYPGGGYIPAHAELQKAAASSVSK